MQKIVVAAFGVMALAVTGCATGNRAYMDSALQNRAEAASVWNRPQEVGFDLGAEITGEAQRQCVLGFVCWGAEDGGSLDAISGLLGSILGGGAQAPSVDPLVRAAAAIAVRDTPKTDGIFIVSHETDLFNIFVYSKRNAKVRGKAITLRPIGEVSQERADKYRNLRAVGGGIVSIPAP